MKRVTAIIVTYNRKDKLRKCIDAVMRQDAVIRPDIIVVDNNSSDGTPEQIRNYCRKCDKDAAERIHYYNLGYNSGGAGGFCYGVRKAVEAGYDYLWLMDDDSIPAKDALAEFLRFDIENTGKYGFLSGKVLWKDGTLCKMNIQRETVMRNIRHMGTTPQRVEMASFVSLFIPAAIAVEAGLPLRQFFIWTDDWEYTRRISLKHSCWLIPTSTVVHDTDRNTWADIASYPADKTDRFRYLYRNDVYLYRREGLRGFVYETARLGVHTFRIAVSRNSIREKLRRVNIMLKGTYDGIRFYPEPERILPLEGDSK